MDLTETQKEKVAEIFRKVTYGRVTFYLSPAKRTIDYTVETQGKLDREQALTGAERERNM